MIRIFIWNTWHPPAPPAIRRSPKPAALLAQVKQEQIEQQREENVKPPVGETPEQVISCRR